MWPKFLFAMFFKFLTKWMFGIDVSKTAKCIYYIWKWPKFIWALSSVTRKTTLAPFHFSWGLVWSSHWIFSELQRCCKPASGCDCQSHFTMIRHQWDFRQTTKGNVANCDHTAAWAQRLRDWVRRCDACCLHYARPPLHNPCRVSTQRWR